MVLVKGEWFDLLTGICNVDVFVLVNGRLYKKLRLIPMNKVLPYYGNKYLNPATFFVTDVIIAHMIKIPNAPPSLQKRLSVSIAIALGKPITKNNVKDIFQKCIALSYLQY